MLLAGLLLSLCCLLVVVVCVYGLCLPVVLGVWFDLAGCLAAVNLV